MCVSSISVNLLQEYLGGALEMLFCKQKQKKIENSCRNQVNILQFLLVRNVYGKMMAIDD